MGEVDYGLIAELFVSNGWEWRFADGKHVPTEDDIVKVSENLLSQLIEHDGSSIECGRLRIINDRDSGKFEIYVNVGEIKENNDES